MKLKKILIAIIAVLFLLNSQGMATELNEAILADDFSSVKLILAGDPKKKLIGKKDDFGRFPLHNAVINGNRDILDYIVMGDIDINPEDDLGLTPLVYAVQGNDIEMVKHLLELGADPAIPGKFDNIALHYAVMMGSAEMAELFISKSLILSDSQNKLGQTPLQMAAEAGNLEMIDFLISKGADPNHRDARGITPLHEAVINGHVEATKLLLDKGADVDLQTTDGLENSDTREASSLHLAVIFGRVEILPVIFEKNVFTARRNKDGYTPVMIAIKENHTTMLDTLLSKGASVENDVDYVKPLDLALEKKDYELATKLIEHGANVDHVNRKDETPLILSIENNDLKSIKLLLDNGANVEGVENGEDPLQYALDRLNADAIELLLNAGADPNAPDKKGRTPLYIAIEEQKIGLARLLVEKGGNAGFVSSTWKLTPVQLAIDLKNLDMLSLLIVNGAPVDVETDFDKIPLAMAIRAGAPFVSYILQSGNVNLSTTDEDGNTFLHFAAIYENNGRIARELIDHGINIDSVNNEGQTPLHVAASKGNNEVVKILVSLGADINAKDTDGNTPLMLSKGEIEHFLSLYGAKRASDL